MSEITLGEPTELPERHRSTYSEIWEAARAKPGKWMPVLGLDDTYFRPQARVTKEVRHCTSAGSTGKRESGH